MTTELHDEHVKESMNFQVDTIDDAYIGDPWHRFNNAIHELCGEGASELYLGVLADAARELGALGIEFPEIYEQVHQACFAVTVNEAQDQMEMRQATPPAV